MRLRIAAVTVKNFRAIKDARLELSDLTALVGPNGCGKSTFLHALELFFGNDSVSIDDFYGRSTNEEMSITVEFEDLSAEDRGKFGSYASGPIMAVCKAFSAENAGGMTGSYYGSLPACPDFTAVRRMLSGKAKFADIKAEYAKLQAIEDYASLPSCRGAEDVRNALSAWEQSHTECLIVSRDDGLFFGWKNVANGYLRARCVFLLVPAVRDAALDAADSKGSVLSQLMELVVRSVIQSRKAFLDFKTEVDRRYAELTAPKNLPELGTLGAELTTTLDTYAPGAEVALDWSEAGTVEMNPPKSTVALVEDGFGAPVDRCGHGTQRAFIFTLLQHLQRATLLPAPSSVTSEEGEEAMAGAPQARPSPPHLLFAIEEPELYQHPNRQRHLATVLSKIAGGGIAGVSTTSQVIYTTHSPLFVGIDRLDSVRRLRKDTVPGAPNATRVHASTLTSVAEQLAVANGHNPGHHTYTAETTRARLRNIMTPWTNEGFFADLVVLVEGEDDRAALIASAHEAGLDPESEGVAVIPCGGKRNIDRPLAVFSSLGIPCYVVWDSDEGKKDAKAEENSTLLRLLQAEPEDWPSGIHATYTCLDPNLEVVMQRELGAALYDKMLEKHSEECGLGSRKDACKSPAVLEGILREAHDSYNTSCPTLDGIVAAVKTLLAAETAP